MEKNQKQNSATHRKAGKQQKHGDAQKLLCLRFFQPEPGPYTSMSKPAECYAVKEHMKERISFRHG